METEPILELAPGFMVIVTFSPRAGYLLLMDISPETPVEVYFSQVIT